jgi:hypothetical protein
VAVVPESIRTTIGTAPSVKVIGVPVPDVPERPSKGILNLVIAVEPGSSPDGTRLIKVKLPQYLSVSIPPKTIEPPAEVSSLVYKE